MVVKFLKFSVLRTILKCTFFRPLTAARESAKLPPGLCSRKDCVHNAVEYVAAFSGLDWDFSDLNTQSTLKLSFKIHIRIFRLLLAHIRGQFSQDKVSF